MTDDLSSDITRAVISWMSVLYRSMELRAGKLQQKNQIKVN